MKTISFKNREINIAANIFYPEDFIKGQKYPAIICAHPVGGVKEQTAGLYAQNLAKQGFITLSIDAGYQGASGGAARYLEDPYSRVEDFRAAIDYLNTLDHVDSDKIALLGICGAGGYVIDTATIDHRIKVVIGISISTVNIGDMFRLGWFGNEDNLETQRQTIDAVAAATTLEARGGEQQFIPWAPYHVEDIESLDLKSACEYYRTDRAAHPNAPSKGTFTSVAKLLTYDAFNMTDRYLTQPLLLIAGSDAESLWHSQNLMGKAASATKELYLIEHARHVDLYDLPQYVAQAQAKIVSFLKDHL